MAEGYSQGGQGVGSNASGFIGGNQHNQQDQVNIQAVLEATKQLLRKRSAQIRLLTLLFSIIVFGTISTCMRSPGRACTFRNSSSTCEFGFAVAMIAFVASFMSLVIDVTLAVAGRDVIRRSLGTVDVSFNASWTLMWFICFCVLAAQWGKTERAVLPLHLRNAAQSAIAFSFFSIFAWAYLTVLSLQVFSRTPGYTDFNSSDSHTGTSEPGHHSPGDMAVPYQEAPGSDMVHTDPEKQPVF